jgi:hypothetical protein
VLITTTTTTTTTAAAAAATTTTFIFVNDENAGMYFGNELCNGNTSTAVVKYQWQFKADKCLFLGTWGNGKQT